MTTEDLLVELAELGIVLKGCGDRLQFHPRSAVTPELAARMRVHKTELLRLVSHNARKSNSRDFEEVIEDSPLRIDSDGWPVGSIELPDSCPKCARYELWQTIAGNWRCLRCDPPRTALKALEAAERIRRRLGLPSPTGVKEHLAELKAAVNRTTERLQRH